MNDLTIFKFGEKNRLQVQLTVYIQGMTQGKVVHTYRDRHTHAGGNNKQAASQALYHHCGQT